MIADRQSAFFYSGIMDQPYISARWVLVRTGIGLGRAAVLGALTAAFYGVIRPDPPAPAGAPTAD